jgi:TetR/AcrR family transcriptional repressor of bet genes
MGRISLKEKRRGEIIQAFARVLSRHGYAGATMIDIADEAGLSPGLLHHNFKNKREMLVELTDVLIGDFRKRMEQRGSTTMRKDEAYIDAALKLDEKADTIAAKCWVSILAEALRDPGLLEKIRRFLDTEIEVVRSLSEEKLDISGSSAVISYVMGALVFGAFAPKRAIGFASGKGKQIVRSLRKS